MSSNYLVWDGASNGGCCTGSGWLINWMWAAGQAGFLFAPSSFAGLKDSFKMRFPSNSIPPSPQNISVFFPNFFSQWSESRPLKIFLWVFKRFSVCLCGASGSSEDICSLKSQQGRNLKRVPCYSLLAGLWFSAVCSQRLAIAVQCA